VNDFFYSPFTIPITAIVCAFIYIIIKTTLHARVRELEIRERIAMIERGMVPAPEADPRGFDRAMQRMERVQEFRSKSGSRHRRAGVTLMGVGFGLMVLITFAGDSPQSALGVGGFLVVIGLAFFINALFDNHRDEAIARPTGPAGGSTTSASNVPPRQE
jgi:uncharacterized protein DUF6249